MNQLLLNSPRPTRKSRGNTGFSVAAPNFWNYLSFHIRATQSLNPFKTLLKKPAYCCFLSVLLAQTQSCVFLLFLNDFSVYLLLI